VRHADTAVYPTAGNGLVDLVAREVRNTEIKYHAIAKQIKGSKVSQKYCVPSRRNARSFIVLTAHASTNRPCLVWDSIGVDLTGILGGRMAGSSYYKIPAVEAKTHFPTL